MLEPAIREFSYVENLLPRPSGRGWLARYGFALLTVAAALGITLILEPYFGGSAYLLFWAVVPLSAWFGGLGPGILAALLTYATVTYFFFSPVFSLYAQLDDLLRLVIMIATAFLISSLYQSRERSTDRLRHLHQISTALGRALHPEEVAQLILDFRHTYRGSPSVTVVLFGEEDAGVQVWASDGSGAYLREQYRRVLHGSEVPLAGVIAARQPVVLQSHAACAEHFPVFTRLTGAQAIASFPMIVQGKVTGGIEFVYRQPARFNGEGLLFLLAAVQEYSLAFVRTRLYEAEQSARQDAERANDLKVQFLAMISHELRSPLTAIQGFASTLLSADVSFDPASQREFLEIIDAESERLNELVEQLLDLSRLQAGMFSIERAADTVEEIVAAALPQLQTLAAGHDLMTDIPAGLAIHADRRRLAQVLVNLVGNAARYAPPGTPITISARQDGSVAEFTVCDQGPGIPAEQRSLIFNPFHQTEEGKKVGKGMGLGLAISKLIVEAHGGEIRAEDNPAGTGTRIIFSLPLGRSDE